MEWAQSEAMEVIRRHSVHMMYRSACDTHRSWYNAGQSISLTVCFEVVTVTAACIGPFIEAMVPMFRPPCMKRSVPSLRSSVSMTSQRPSVKEKMGVALPGGRVDGGQGSQRQAVIAIRCH